MELIGAFCWCVESEHFVWIVRLSEKYDRDQGDWSVVGNLNYKVRDCEAKQTRNGGDWSQLENISD